MLSWLLFQINFNKFGKLWQQECLSALCFVTFNIVVYAGNDFNWLLNIYTICNLLWLKNYRMIFTSCNKVVAKVMFLHVCVILFTGRVWAGRMPLGRENAPGQGEPPQAGRTLPGSRHPQSRHTPLGADTPWSRPPWKHTPPGSRLQHIVNEWPVRILLECILVCYCFLCWA